MKNKSKSFDDAYNTALRAIVTLVVEHMMDPDRICDQLALSTRLELGMNESPLRSLARTLREEVKIDK